MSSNRSSLLVTLEIVVATHALKKENSSLCNGCITAAVYDGTGVCLGASGCRRFIGGCGSFDGGVILVFEGDDFCKVL